MGLTMLADAALYGSLLFGWWVVAILWLFVAGASAVAWVAFGLLPVALAGQG
jgi:hypothetical protein